MIKISRVGACSTRLIWDICRKNADASRATVSVRSAVARVGALCEASDPRCIFVLSREHERVVRFASEGEMNAFTGKFERAQIRKKSLERFSPQYGPCTAYDVRTIAQRRK